MFRIDEAIGSLLLAYWHQGALVYAGLQAARVAKLAVTGGPPEVDTWVEPRLLPRVTYRNWTDAGLVRHAVFEGLPKTAPEVNAKPRSLRAGPA